MKRFIEISIVMMTLWIAGCAADTYPISGEQCGPEDPVKTLDANDCSVLPTN